MQTRSLPVTAGARRSPNIGTEVVPARWREVGAPAAAREQLDGAPAPDIGIIGSDLKHGFRFGPWEVRPLTGEIRGADETLHVEPKVMEVLFVLARRAGEVVERHDLLCRIWGTRAAVSDEPLTRCIAVLRRALDDSPHRPAYIQTIPKRGYRLLAPVAALVTTEPRHLHDLSREPGDAPPIPGNSIAVLPFIAGSTSADVLDFGVDVAGEIRRRLMSGKDVLVLARSWSDAVGGLRDLRAIRTQLRVAHVLEGRVQRQGDQVRIHIGLCDAQSGYLVWSESFKDVLTTASYFTIQDRIANAVVTKLRESLAPLSSPVAAKSDAPRRAPSHDLQKFVAATSAFPQERRPRRAEYRNRPNRPNTRIEP